MQTYPAVEKNKNIKWSESPWNQSGRKGKGLWRKWFAEKRRLKFRMKHWTSKRRCKWWSWRWRTTMCGRWKWRRLCLTRLAKISSIDKVQHTEKINLWFSKRTGGRARVTIDEERVLWQVWTEIGAEYSSWSYKFGQNWPTQQSHGLSATAVPDVVRELSAKDRGYVFSNQC